MSWRDDGQRKLAPVNYTHVPPGGGGFGAPFQVTFTYRPPVSDAAANFVYSTYAVPRYSPIGPSVPNQRHIRSLQGRDIREPRQGYLMTNAAGVGAVTGQILTGPLLDPRNTSSVPIVIAANSPIGSFSLNRQRGL